jgi:hypothetical protein
VSTPYPATPRQVAALGVGEFTVTLAHGTAPTLDHVCGLFAQDANRAVVWLLRYKALEAVSTALETQSWLTAGAYAPVDLYEVAAGHALNERWEFDGLAFRRAVETLAARRR